MPFYRDQNYLGNISSINQAQGEKNCFIMAPLAAAELCGHNNQISFIKTKMPYKLGGTSDQAFKAVGLYPNTKASIDSESWIKLVEKVVSNRWPACLGIHWSDINEKHKNGNHVIYLTGFDENFIYARDQQNDHALIKFNRAGFDKKNEFKSDIFHTGRGQILRTCNVTWIGVGFKDKEAARETFTYLEHSVATSSSSSSSTSLASIRQTN